MYTLAHKPHFIYYAVCRYGAVIVAAILMSNWLGFVIAEAIRDWKLVPNIHSFPQAVILALVFGGYMLGRRKELAGGLVSILERWHSLFTTGLYWERRPDWRSFGLPLPDFFFFCWRGILTTDASTCNQNCSCGFMDAGCK